MFIYNSTYYTVSLNVSYLLKISCTIFVRSRLIFQQVNMGLNIISIILNVPINSYIKRNVLD